MSATMYTEGDQVRIRKDLKAWERYGGALTSDEMEKLAGKDRTIKFTRDGFYETKEDPFAWTDEMFEPFEPDDPVNNPTRSSILADAKKCVCGDRDEQYGSPENNFDNIGLFWGQYLKARYPDKLKEFPINGITAEDVAMMMCLFKIARIAVGSFKADSYIDLAGYAACGGEIAGEAKARSDFHSAVDACKKEESDFLDKSIMY